MYVPPPRPHPLASLAAWQAPTPFFLPPPLQFHHVVILCESMYSKRIVVGYWPIWYTHLTQGLHTTMPYVLSVYMVRGFLGEDADEELVGYRVGLLGAAFCLAQTFTSYLLGLLSDRIGRKPIIVMGNVSCAVGVVLFGMSQTLVGAVLTRLAMGATNGIIGAEKAYIGDNMSRDEQAEAMGLISLTWGVGSLLGPLLGGALSGLVFSSRPFLLPCLVASAVSVVGVVSSVLFLEEGPGVDAAKGGERRGHGRRRTDEEACQPLRQPEPLEPLEPLKEITNDTAARRAALHKKNSDLFRADSIPDSIPDGIPASDKFVSAFEIEADVGEEKEIEHAGESAASSRPVWWRDEHVILALAGYTGVAFSYIALDELVPLFASASRADGGLGYSPEMLAGPLAFSGLVLVFWMLGGYKWLQQLVGTKHTCVIGLWMTIGVVLLFPLASVIPMARVGAVVFWVGMGLKSVSGSNAFTSCLVLVNLAAPKESLGQVNGAGQTLASAVRALGPWLGGILWSLSLVVFKSLGIPSGHQWVPFALPVMLAVGCLSIYGRLRIRE